MINKGSDINVANIEDIKVIQHIISFYKDLDVIHSNDKCKEIVALENVLAELEQKDKRIKELEEYISIAPNLNEMTATKYITIQQEAYIRGKAEEQRRAEQIIYENYIPKQVVRDKIKEYDKKMEEDAEHPNWVITDRIVINVLQELLEGDAKK